MLKFNEKKCVCEAEGVIIKKKMGWRCMVYRNRYQNKGII